MSKIHSIDFEYEHDYALIGIHSALEDYRIAYFLNEKLNIHLSRFKQDLDFSSINCSFSLYHYEDKKTFTSWSLIANKYLFTSEVDYDPSNLFPKEAITSFLVSEKKKVDYFIKINGQLKDNNVHDILSNINNIHQVITSYTIDPNQLKSRDHLIF